MLLIFQPGLEAVDPGGLIAALSALSLLISQTFANFAVSGMAGALIRESVKPTLEHTLLVAGCAIIAAIAFYCLTQAHRIASPVVVAPFAYSGMLWGVLFRHGMPNAPAIAGMAIILVSGINIMHRQAMRARSTERPAIAAAASRRNPARGMFRARGCRNSPRWSIQWGALAGRRKPTR